MLDSGAVRYAVLDHGPWLRRGPVRRPDISHCVHAITRTNEALRIASTPALAYGEFITRKLANTINEVGLLVDPGTTHDWLLGALEVDHYPLKRRSLGEPLLKVRR